MTYPEHYLFSFGGTMAGGQEIWSNNVRFWTDDLVVEADGAEMNALGKLETDLRALAANAGSKWSAGVRVEWLKFNRINEFGRYASTVESNTKFLNATTAFGGSAGNLVLPPQVAIAVTFRSELARGRASKGRLYIPMPNVTTGNDGRVKPEDTASIALAYKTWIQAMGNWPGPDFNTIAPAVVSGVGTGAASYIRRVEVGNVFDTQRRRRNALVEVRASQDVPDPT